MVVVYQSKMERTTMYMVIGGILASTYVVNAIGAIFYRNNCISLMSYNSPICGTVLVGVTGAATVNYYIYYVVVASVIGWCLSKMKF